ncbi:tetratricopeptide repeat protein [Alteraurantiacibacter aestuarii]|uniref:tetratricopeptide repeat protein n=1 Tax=Alteraurantiacibacter aestuarii TaxID=650004 RepID=UPI0031D217D0
MAAGFVVGMVPGAAQAQVDDRINRIETQLRALQRVVFPGGDERFFEPEITAAPGQSQVRQPGTTSGTALTDMLVRLDAIEAQLTRLTASTEVNDNALSLLEARIVAMEERAALAQQPTGVINMPADRPADQPAALASADQPQQPASAAATAATTAAAGPTPERLAGVQAITKPATDDAGDDEYTYGFRLWDAKFYPEAQQQLALFVERYPDHWRTTYGRNLLGRAFLDAGDARRAATHFFENYQSDKQAARAPDSLLYLAESMIALGDTSRACIALAEFGDTYPALATGRLQAQYDANRGRVDCAN